MAPDVPRMGGAIVVSARKVLQELCGEDGFGRAMAQLPPPVAEQYVSATSLTWVPISVIEQVVWAAAAELGRDPLVLNDEIGRVSTERTLHGVWRVLLRFTTDSALLSRTPVIYAKTYDTGHIVPVITGPGRATVELCDYPDPPDLVLRGLGVGIETTLRCAGRALARVTHERTPRGAIYNASWQA